MAGARLRLAGAGLMVGSGWVQACVGVLTSAVGSLLAFRWARPDGEATSRPAYLPGELKPYRRKVLRYMLPTLPAAAYFAVQGPLVVWLSATFGGARNIAEVGALGRLGLVVGLFSGLTGTVF